MIQVFGVEWYNTQEDFDVAYEKLKASLKDGEETSIVYISSDSDFCHEVLAKGVFVPGTGGKMVPSIRINQNLIESLDIKVKNNSKLIS